ncbi:hypothetical protein BH10PLA2_BH10PLA2_30710 [soil metagenome]
MKRLYLTVEGQTEAAIATSVLTPHLANFNVFLTAPRFTGLHKRRRGRIPQGGMLNTFGHALADMKTWLKEDQSPEARFSMMVDLYSLPNDFPGFETGMAGPSGREQALALQFSLAAEMGDVRFIPYLQVHEYESLVLVDPRRISSIRYARSTDRSPVSGMCLLRDSRRNQPRSTFASKVSNSAKGQGVR